MILDHFHGDFGPVIKQISEMMDSGLDNSLRNTGLTSMQARMLIALDMADGGSMTQRELEDLFMVSHPTVVGLVRRMQSKGLVTLSEQTGNRSKDVTLTEEGRRTAHEIDGTIRWTEATIVRGLDASEQEELRRLLLKVHSNLAEDRRGAGR